MRILHVVEATSAGVCAHVQVITASFDQRRFQLVVACPAPPGKRLRRRSVRQFSHQHWHPNRAGRDATVDL
jgi:hypothetical protein